MRLHIAGGAPVTHGVVPKLVGHSGLGKVSGSAQFNLLDLSFSYAIALGVTSLGRLLQYAQQTASHFELPGVIAVQLFDIVQTLVVCEVLRGFHAVFGMGGITGDESTEQVVKHNSEAMQLARLLLVAVQHEVVGSDQLTKARERTPYGLDAPSVLSAPDAHEIANGTPGVVRFVAQLVLDRLCLSL